METKKLGLEAAFPRPAELNENSGTSQFSNLPQTGMSIILYAATTYADISSDISKHIEPKEGFKLLGLPEDTRWEYKHTMMLVTKIQFLLANELLKRELEYKNL